jgi:hypothetical protein
MEAAGSSTDIVEELKRLQNVAAKLEEDIEVFSRDFSNATIALEAATAR